MLELIEFSDLQTQALLRYLHCRRQLKVALDKQDSAIHADPKAVSKTLFKRRVTDAGLPVSQSVTYFTNAKALFNTITEEARVYSIWSKNQQQDSELTRDLYSRVERKC